jgi:hypothetical protein
MPRYGPPPSADPPPGKDDDDKSSLTNWSWRAKALAVIAGFGMVAAFVFEFLPPTSSGPTKISTSVVTSTTTELSTTTSVSTTSTSVAVTTTTRP